MPTVIRTFEQKRKLVSARRRLFEGAQRLLAQQRRVRALKACGHPAAAQAQHLLTIFADSQLAIYAAQSTLEQRRSGWGQPFLGRVTAAQLPKPARRR